MPAIGVSQNFGLTTPGGCVINESTEEKSVKIVTYRDEDGNIAGASPVKMVETKVSIKGVGIPDISEVAATASIGSGVVVVTEMSVEESAEEYPKFTMSGVSFTTRS